MEKAVLVGIKLKAENTPLDESIEELKKLALSANARAIKVISQVRDKPDLKYFIGTGKAEELKEICANKEADLVIIDHTVSPSQARNLEELIGKKVIDRTELILDIFARHAHSHEGKLQVELAQTSFRLTHLTGFGTMLSRLGGGESEPGDQVKRN
ncbi:hypothetical protein ACFL52_02775 [Candidatus Margulisiibacteriota bacterium]